MKLERISDKTLLITWWIVFLKCQAKECRAPLFSHPHQASRAREKIVEGHQVRVAASGQPHYDIVSHIYRM